MTVTGNLISIPILNFSASPQLIPAGTSLTTITAAEDCEICTVKSHQSLQFVLHLHRNQFTARCLCRNNPCWSYSCSGYWPSPPPGVIWPFQLRRSFSEPNVCCPASNRHRGCKPYQPPSLSCLPCRTSCDPRRSWQNAHKRRYCTFFQSVGVPCGTSKEERRQLALLCWLPTLEQHHTQGRLPPAPNRWRLGLPPRRHVLFLHRPTLRILADYRWCHGPWKDCLRHTRWTLPLQGYAFWIV